MIKEKEAIISLITDFLENSPENFMGEKFPGEKMWADPLVGFANGADQLFTEYKKEEICGEQHWTPAEIFALAFPEEDFTADQLTVVSWILPQTKETKEEMRKAKEFPGERWSRARALGENVNIKLREHLAEQLTKNNLPAVAPLLFPQWQMLPSEQRQITSNWSERHAAYASGLGTFALCDGLITQAGKAHRCGSVVVKAQIQPCARPYTKHTEYCLYFTKGTCGACIKRCPYGAISSDGHDKNKCRYYCHEIVAHYIQENYGIAGYGCGLCQTAVPCTDRIPDYK